MTNSTEPWVQRLRDGATADRRPVLLGAGIATAVGVLVLVAEFAFPDFLRGVESARTQTSLVFWPVILVAIGGLLALSMWSAGRSDRRTMARIRRHRAPRLHLPVFASGLRTTDDFPEPRPEIWTVDEAGLHAWAPSRDEPVFDLPWSGVRDVDVATKDQKGQRVDFGIWISTTDRRDVVLQPRQAIGHGIEAGPAKLAVLVDELRSLRRELDPGFGERGRR